MNKVVGYGLGLHKTRAGAGLRVMVRRLRLRMGIRNLPPEVASFVYGYG